jgi:hypothetical protein
MKAILVIGVVTVALLYIASCWSIAQPFAGARTVTITRRAEAVTCERVVRALTERFPHRSGGNDDELAAAGLWLEGQLAERGLLSERQKYDGSRFNVLSSVGVGQHPEIVIGAHYDAHEDTPGADDNASGVAVLLEVLRSLAVQPPGCRVEAAFWTLEEPPYFRTASMGSRHHAEQLQAERAPLRFALSLEMLGYFSDVQRYPPGFVYAPAYPSRGDFVLLLGDSRSADLTRRLKSAFHGSTPLPVASLNVSQTFPGADFSDHASFWRAGFTAFMLTDTAFLRNPHYHHPTDTADRLDYVRLAQVADGVAAMVLDACPP